MVRDASLMTALTAADPAVLGIRLPAFGGDVLPEVGMATRSNAQLVQNICNSAEAWGTRQGLGNGPVAGTLKHGYADRLLTRYQEMFGSPRLENRGSLY